MAQDFLVAGAEGGPPVIERGLVRVCGWSGCRRVDLDLLAESGSEPVWSVSSVGAAGLPRSITAQVLSHPELHAWLYAELSRGGELSIGNVLDLPEAASAERELFSGLDAGSRLFIPVVVVGRLLGCLTLEHGSADHAWPSMLVGRLRMLAEVYASVALRELNDQARRRAEVRFETLTEFSQHIVCEFDVRGELIFLSPSVREILGVEPESVLGFGFLDLIHPDDRERAVESIRLDPDLPFDELSLRLRRSDGQYIWVEAEGSSFPGTDGPRRILAVLRDVTDRHQRQAELTEQLDIERELSQLSRELVGLESASLAETFSNALGAAAGIAGCDHAFALGVMADLNAGVPEVHVWTRPGLGARPIDFDPSRVDGMGWTRRKLFAGESVVVPDVDALPDEAASEREVLRARNVGSFLGIPLREGTRSMGLVGFASVGRKTRWSDHQLSMLRLVAELFGAVFRRARSEAHLREREERFRVLADQSPDPIIELSDTGQVLYASTDFAALLGDPDEDWVGRYLVDFVEAGEVPRINQVRDRSRSGRRVSPTVFQCRHADGTPRFIEATVRSFESVTGARHGMATLRDVTAKLESERTLEQQIVLERQIVQISSDFLERNVDELQDGVRRAMGIVGHLARADRCGVVTYGSQGGEPGEIYEWFVDGLPESGRGPIELDPAAHPLLTRTLLQGERFAVRRPEDLPAAGAAERATMERLGMRSFLVIPFMAGGQMAGLFALISLSEELDWSHEDLTLLNLASDIMHGALRRRQAALELEESQLQLLQSQKMEAVGTLAGGIAHDFNNQLSVMLGNVRYVLERQVETGDSRDALLDLERAAEHCAQLTRSLLAFSRQGVQEQRTVGVAIWLAEVAELVKPLLPASIALYIETADRVGAVHGDETQLQQVVVNLLVNARDAMPAGGRIRMRARRMKLSEARRERLSLPSSDMVELCIEDDGQGMSEGVRARVFEPFFTTKSIGKGTGLGLATVYGIVQQYGGGIEVESELGQGTRFSVYLPAHDEVALGTALGPDDDRPLSRSFDTILLVEDEPAVRRVVHRMLESRAKNVIQARDGRDALEQVADRLDEIDLLVTDMVMPRMGGLALARRIAETRPDLPTLFLSGYPDDELDFDREPLLHHRFLQKPFTERDLSAAMEALLLMPPQTDDRES